MRILRFAAAVLAALALCGFSQPRPPGWVMKGAHIDCDFANGRYYNCIAGTSFATTRAGTSSLTRDANGIWYRFPTNTNRLTTLGLSSEGAATNLALWSRDMTQSGSWTATNMTTALTGTGLDGTANSASRLTSTSTNATVTQTVGSLASAQYPTGVFIKRVTGSGQIFVTQDNFASISTCAPPSTTAWSFCGKGSASVTTATIGIKLAASGDVVLVDGWMLTAVLNSGTANQPQPIITTTASVTANADDVELLGNILDMMKRKVYSISVQVWLAATSASPGAIIRGTADATPYNWNNSTGFRVASGANICAAGTPSGLNFTNGANGTGPTNGLVAGTDANTNGADCSFNSGAVASNTYAPGANTAFGFGNAAGSTSNSSYSTFGRLTLWPYKLDAIAIQTASCVSGNC